MASHFLISLDVEMQWGFYDLPTRLSEASISRIPEVVKRLLELFERYEVDSTWGIVGALACETVEELQSELATIPFGYLNERCHPTTIFQEITRRPHHFFAPQLVEQIRSAPNVEVASHTFSHFYTRELPFSEDAWRQDLHLVKRKLPEATTLLFPRNQYHENALKASREFGFTAFRMNPNHFLYRVETSGKGTLPIRLMRLADHYFPIGSHQLVESAEDQISYSRFLRPPERSSYLRRRKVDRIKQSMTVAAMKDRDYHIYFHPHNLSLRTDQGLQDLEELLQHFHYLQRTFGMESITIREYFSKDVKTE